MSTSVLVQQRNLAGHDHTKYLKGTVDTEIPLKYNKIKEVIHSVNSMILETILSVLLVSGFLGIYLLTGLHTWWIQLAEKFTFLP